MEAKDRILSPEQVTKLLLEETQKFHLEFNPRTEQFERMPSPTLEEFILIGAEEQDEISFKAGQEAGRNEVVEFVEANKLHAGNISITGKSWQAKLKEWGI